MLPVALGEHLASERPATPEQPVEVDAHDVAVELVVDLLGGCARAGDAGAGDEDVGATMVGGNAVSDTIHRRRVGDFDLVGGDLEAGGRQFCPCPLELLGVA